MIPKLYTHKLEHKIEILGKRRYRAVATVPLEIADTTEHFRKPPAGLDYRKIAVGEKWGCAGGSAWFRGKIRLNAECKGKRVYYRMLTWGEMLLFVDGKPFAGLDHKHHEVLLTRKARGNESWRVAVEAYAGHKLPSHNPFSTGWHWHQSTQSRTNQPAPLTLHGSEILVEREATTKLFYDMEILHRTAKTLDEESMRRAHILDRLIEAADMIPMEIESEEEWTRCVGAAQKHIAPLLRAKNGTSTPHIGLVGHTHIDISWLWPVKESRRKAARSFSTMLALMDDYPELTFFQSQAQLLETVAQDYPDLIPRIRAAVRRGKWEPNGAMYVEPDGNLPSGESYIRQIVEGRKITMRLFGTEGDTMWAPDIFGVNGALPQILVKSGIKNFVTSKLRFYDRTPFPYDTFWWEGIDGTDIFVHFIGCEMTGYNSEAYPEIWKDRWKFVRIKESMDRVLQSIGWGDGGAAVTREMCEHVRRMNDLEGCMRASFVNGSERLREIREQKTERPRWVGELYLERHRGCLTSQARTKRWNRKLEFLLREVEWLSAMAIGKGLAYPAAELQRNWRTLLVNQFHDILPGSAIRRTYEVAEAEYAQMEQDLGTLRAKAIDVLSRDLRAPERGERRVLVNSLSWNRDEIAWIEGGSFHSAYDGKGQALPVQEMELEGKRYLGVKAKAAAMSLAPIALSKSKAKAAPSPFKNSARGLETPFYRVKFDAAGKIVSLIDKDASGREIVQKGRRLNDIFSAEDLPDFADAWEISKYYRDKMTFEDRLISREVAADGPLCFCLRSKYRIGKGSTLSQDMVFYAHSRRIDFGTIVDWQETHVLLKAGFAVDILADSCRNEIQFGHLVRPTHSNTPSDEAKFETCAHKWVDVSEENYGVAILNDCKYGLDTLDKMVSLTLLKSPVGPDEIADKGRQEFNYSLFPHLGGFCAETVVREGYAINVPLSIHAPAAPQARNRAADAVGFCTVSNPNIIVETVKKAEESGALIVRVYEAGRTRGPARLEFARPCRKAWECNLIELDDKPVAVRGNAIEFEIRPFEIKTFKIDLG